MAGHHQQVKFGFLGIAQKKILADLNAKETVNIMAGFNGGDSLVIQTFIGNMQPVKNIVGADFLGKTSFIGLGTSMVKNRVNEKVIHENSP